MSSRRSFLVNDLVCTEVWEKRPLVFFPPGTSLSNMTPSLSIIVTSLVILVVLWRSANGFKRQILPVVSARTSSSRTLSAATFPKASSSFLLRLMLDLGTVTAKPAREVVGSYPTMDYSHFRFGWCQFHYIVLEILFCRVDQECHIC